MIRSLSGGGMERVVMTLAKAFAERGHRVTVLVGVPSGALRNHVPPTVHLVPLDLCSHLGARLWAMAADPGGIGCMLPLLISASPRMLRHLRSLVSFLRTNKPDMLIAVGTQSNLTALWAKRFSGVTTKIAVSEHNTLSLVAKHGRPWFRRSYPAMVRRAYPHADAIIAVSQGVADDLSRVTMIPRERITAIYNPVVSAELVAKSQVPLDHPWLRTGEPPLILGIGRLHRQKDFPTLLRAFARVREVCPTRLVLLGEGAERHALEQLAADLHLTADLSLPGFVDNPFPWLARANVFVLSSIWEGFANVLVEALACGCPVVSTDCPSGPAEILDRGIYGPLVPVGDEQALAKAILSVLQCPIDRARLRARAAIFSLDAAVDRYLEIILRALP